MYSDEALITLSGGETEIAFYHSHNFYHVQNLGTASVKISTAPNISGRDDGLIEIPSGGSATISSGKSNKLYVYGSGRINVACSDSNNNPFRNAAKGGGGGGTGVTSYPALTDLPSINGITLLGDKTSKDLGITGEGGTSNYEDLGLVVDKVLSEASINPVENRVIRQALINYLSNAKSYTDEQIANLIDGSETILETLDRIAQAMKENHDVVEALDKAIGEKADKTDLNAHINNHNNPHRVTKEDVGLDKVDNTPDAEKDVRSAGKLSNPVKIIINNEEQEFDGTKDVEFDIPTGGGEGTDNYNDLENKPSINGHVVENEVTQEDLGWYALTSEEAADIVNKAFNKIAPSYITVAEYPLTDTIDDGYGLTFTNKSSIDSHITNNGLSLDRNFNFSFSVDDYDPAVNDTIIISFDIKYLESEGRTATIFLQNNAGQYYWGLANAVYNSKYNFAMMCKADTGSYHNTEIPVNKDNNWYTMCFKLTNYQRHCEIKYADYDYVSCNDIGIDDVPYENTENKSFTFNPSMVAYGISIKNLKVMISK